MIRVAVIAAAPIGRAGLRGLLTADNIEIVGEAALPEDLVGAAEEIDVLVLGDSSVSQHSLFPLAENGARGIVVLSEEEGPLRMLESLPLAGWGIVPPDASGAELIAAVEAVAQGFVAISLPMAKRLFAGGTPVRLGSDVLEEPLTEREMEVLELLSQGLPNKLIARQLGISEHTVKFHVSSLYTKLGAASRTEAVHRGARLGLVTF